MMDDQPVLFVNDDVLPTRARTMKLGLTWHEPDNRIDDGYIVYSSIYPRDKSHNFVRVLNMRGEQVHCWDLGKKRPGLWAYIPDSECTARYHTISHTKGFLFAISQMPKHEVKQQHDFIAWESDRGGYMQLITFDGQILWTYKDEYQHHDARLTRTGMVAYIANELLKGKKEIRSIVDVAASHRGFPQLPILPKIYADVIKVVDPLSGEVLFSWKAADHLDPEVDVLNYNDPFDEWNHGNTIVPLYENPDDRSELTHLMVSFRQISTIVKIEVKTGDFVRLLKTPFISQQHDCSPLEDGNTNRILVFDNRYVPNDFAPSAFSVVTEWNLTETAPFRFLPMITGPRLEWMYVDGVCDLFSSHISGAQRLPDWNLKDHGFHYTLITEGMKGRIFMVKTTASIKDGKPLLKNKVIWEFMNPEIAPGQNKDVILGRSAVFRSRYVKSSLFTEDQLRIMKKQKTLPLAKL